MNKEQIEEIRSSMTYLLSDLEYHNELFPLLFVDIENKAVRLSRSLFESDDRRVAIYGPRGIGKTSLLHGIAFEGLRSGAKRVPIVCKISEARSVSSVADLEDRFFTSTVKGIASVPQIHDKWATLSKKKGLVGVAPWISSAILGAAAYFVTPLAVVSSVMTTAIDSVVKTSKTSSLEEMLTATPTRVNRLSDLLIQKLQKSDIEPVFIIDELDKVIDQDIIHGFIEGNQTWFEGKNVILTVSHNVGESLQKITSGSITRIASVERFDGMTSGDQGRSIIMKRASLGLSMAYGLSNDKAVEEVEKVLPREIQNEIIERTFPSPFQMLRLAYNSLEQSGSQGRPLQDVIGAGVQVIGVKITKQRLQILNILSKGPLNSADLADKLNKNPKSMFTSLMLMVRRGLLMTTKEGRTVLYHLTEQGERVRRLNS